MYNIKDLAIVILNWNGKPLLEQFLPSVIKHSVEATIYVADNGSTDDSVTFLADHFPEIKIIKNNTNLGYAGGYNKALTSVKEPLLCLLNSDVEVTENWLSPIIKTFNTDKNTAIIQPKVLDYYKRNYFEYAGAGGGFIDRYAYPYCRGRIFYTIEEDKSKYNDEIPIFWATGACFFIKHDVFKQLGGFDTSYFAHMEEIDLCWRAFNTNYNCMYVGASTIYHVGGATLQNTNPKKTYLNFRNSLFNLVKHTDKHVLSRTFIRMILDGIAGIRFLFMGKFSFCFAVLRAHLSFCKNLPHLLEKRKQLPKRPGYATSKSIVWLYYIKQQKFFNS